MKRNLYLLTAGLVLCSCTEPGDVVTGYARIVTKSSPVAPPVVQPAPAPVQAAPVATVRPAPSAPVKEQFVIEAPVIQPEPIAQPAPAPVATQPTIITKPAPAAVAAAPAPVVYPPVVSQQQPVVTTPAPAPAPAATQKPVAQVTHPVYSAPVSQQQPVLSTPPARVDWNSPRQVAPKKRDYPIMPGQNRGLRNRKPSNIYYYN